MSVQIEPVTTLARDHKVVFGKLANGPVYLAQRSKPAAVLLSINDYESLEEDAKRWRRQALADVRSQELKVNPNLGVSIDELERGLANA